MSKLTDAPNYSAKTKKRVLKGILGSSLVVILVMSFLLSRPPMVTTDPGKISVTLNAQVIRNGVLINEVTKEDDLLLSNFMNVTEVLLRWPDGETGAAELKNDEPGPVDYTFLNATSDYTIWDTDATAFDIIVEGRYGEGTTAPDRDDLDVETEKLSCLGVTSFSFDSGSFTLTFIETNDAGAWDWSETGYLIQWYSFEDGDMWWICLIRDTFSPMGVVNGDSLVINYRFNFASGYNQNFITLLAYTLMGASDGAETDIEMVDTGGSTRDVILYTGDQDTEFYGHSSNSLHGGHIAVSDSSAGIPDRDAYRILGSSLQTSCTTTGDYDVYEITVEAVFIPTTEISIVCAAYYRYTVYDGGTGYFMFFALAHGSVYVAGGTPVKASFTVGL